jgi:hypothetical protein
VTNGAGIHTALEITFTFKSHPDEPVTIPSLSCFERVPAGEEEARKVKSSLIYEDLGPVNENIGGID